MKQWGGVWGGRGKSKIKIWANWMRGGCTFSHAAALDKVPTKLIFVDWSAAYGSPYLLEGVGQIRTAEQVVVGGIYRVRKKSQFQDVHVENQE